MSNAGLTVVVYGQPTSQGSKRIVTRGGVTRMIEQTVKSLKVWRQQITAAVRDELNGTGPFEGPVELTVTFTMQPSKVKAKAICREHEAGLDLVHPHTNHPDLDKMVRAVCDSLTDAGAWTDDKQAARIKATKLYAMSHGALPQPGAVITIRPYTL